MLLKTNGLKTREDEAKFRELSKQKQEKVILGNKGFGKEAFG